MAVCGSGGSEPLGKRGQGFEVFGRVPRSHCLNVGEAGNDAKEADVEEKALWNCSWPYLLHSSDASKPHVMGRPKQ